MSRKFDPRQLTALVCSFMVLMAVLFSLIWPILSAQLAAASIFNIPLAYFIAVLVLPSILIGFLFYSAHRQEEAEFRFEDSEND